MANKPAAFAQSFQISQHILLVAPTGKGKTVWLYNLVKGLPIKDGDLLVVLNTMNLEGWRQVTEYEHVERGTIIYDNEEKPKSQRRITDVELPGLSALMRLKDNVKYKDGTVHRPPRKICVTVPLIQVMEEEGFNSPYDYCFWYFNQICRLSMLRGNTFIVCDEGALVVRGEELSPWMATVMLQGRNQNVSLLFAAQRRQDISKKISDNVTHYILFQNPGRIVKALSDIPGIERSENIPPYYWIWVDQRTNEPIVYTPAPLLYNDRKRDVKPVWEVPLADDTPPPEQL